jgi:DNA polymerase-3 subunit alpha
LIRSRVVLLACSDKVSNTFGKDIWSFGKKVALSKFCHIFYIRLISAEAANTFAAGNQNACYIMSFTHLHVHTLYSTLDGMSRIEDLFNKAEEYGMRGLAITDHGTMSGVPEFLKAAKKHPGIKPIIGCEMYVTKGSLLDKGSLQSGDRYHLVLLAKNEKGYRNLVKMVTIANTEGMNKRPMVDHDTLKQYYDGLIALSACIGGEIPQAILSGDLQEAQRLACLYRDVFGEDFYLEVSQHKSKKPGYKGDVFEKQKKANAEIFSLGERLEIPVVATNDVHFVSKEDSVAHDVMLCANTNTQMDDPNRFSFTGEEYLKSKEEMREIFHDHPEVIFNTGMIVEKIQKIDINGDGQWPDYPIPDTFRTPIRYLRHLAHEGLKDRTGGRWSEGEKERLEFELLEVASHNLTNQFLVTWDLVRALREIGCMTGIGRGAAASSYLNYVLHITDFNPVKYSLLFERYIPSYKNISSQITVDLDLDEKGFNHAFDYLAKKYGKMHVCRVSTFACRSERSAKKDTLKTYGIDDSEGNPDIPLEHIQTAKLLEGTISRIGTHSSAIVLSKTPLNLYVPLSLTGGNGKEQNDYKSQYDGRFFLENGPRYINILRLWSLDIMKEASEGIRIPDTYENPKVFEIFSKGDTSGIFMFESAGMKDWLKQLQPTEFRQLVALNALYRPGSMYNIPYYIEGCDYLKKHNAIKCIHPIFEEYLHDTYGILIYQEQLMIIACKLGLSKEDADLLRKAIPNNKYDIINSLKSRVLNGEMSGSIPEDEMELCWKYLIEQGKHAFLEAHSAAYCATAYRMAWLKVYHPQKFYQAWYNVECRKNRGEFALKMIREA